jgi:hypothetical protein
MLLELDLKDPTSLEAVEQLLTEADMWDHLVGHHSAPSWEKDPRAALLPGTYLVWGRGDMDPAVASEHLPEPGHFLTVRDPRLVSELLERQSIIPQIDLSTDLHDSAAARLCPDYPVLCPWAPDLQYASRGELFRELRTGMDSREVVPSSPEQRAARREEIRRRATAAYLLGRAGLKTPTTVRVLLETVRHRTLDPDPAYHGLDGAMAVRALARLEAVEAVPALIAEFRSIDPALEQLGPTAQDYPASWRDEPLEERIIQALGDLPCPSAKDFLLEYCSRDDTRRAEFGRVIYDYPERSLVRQEFSQEEWLELIEGENRHLAGHAVQYLLDHPSLTGDEVLAAATPWALALPRVPRDCYTPD